MQDITGNEQFWKIIWPYFSDKGYNQTKITNCRKRFYYGRQKNTTLMNNYYINITKKNRFEPFDSL